MFTNVNAAAPNSGGDVSNTSQVRSTYFGLIQLFGEQISVKLETPIRGEPWGDKSAVRFLRGLKRECFPA